MLSKALIYVSVALTCGPADVEDKTQEDWTRRDSLSLSRAFITCNDTYGACLKLFIKKGAGRYHAICKKPTKEMGG